MKRDKVSVVTKLAGDYIAKTYGIVPTREVSLSRKYRVDLYAEDSSTIILGEVKTAFGDSKRLVSQLKTYSKMVQKSSQKKTLLLGFLDADTYTKVVSREYELGAEVLDRLLVVNTQDELVLTAGETPVEEFIIRFKEKNIMETTNTATLDWFLDSCSKIEGQKFLTSTGITIWVASVSKDRPKVEITATNRSRPAQFTEFKLKAYLDRYNSIRSLDPKDYNKVKIEGHGKTEMTGGVKFTTILKACLDLNSSKTTSSFSIESAKVEESSLTKTEDEKFLNFKDQMERKFLSGRKQYGTEIVIDPVVEAQSECLDLANYSMMIYYRLEKLKQNLNVLVGEK